MTKIVMRFLWILSICVVDLTSGDELPALGCRVIIYSRLTEGGRDRLVTRALAGVLKPSDTDPRQIKISNEKFDVIGCDHIIVVSSSMLNKRHYGNTLDKLLKDSRASLTCYYVFKGKVTLVSGALLDISDIIDPKRQERRK